MITETGYSRSTFEDIISDLTLKAKELFGEDIDTSEQTPLGKFIHMMAYVRGKDHENAEMLYFSRFPSTAIGTSLDRLCPFVGLTRNVATPARYEVKVTGEAGAVIPFGFLVSTDSDIEFYNTIETVIPTETTCVIQVECTIAGSIGNIAPSNITEVVNPEAGIDSVIGISVISNGEDEESDFDLRKRILASTEGAGSCNEAAIKAALLRVPTVTSATVVVNDTDITDSAGNLPHSISCYVAGGTDYSKEIAETIFEKRPMGIKTNGSISVDVIDDGGYSHNIKYNKIKNVNITVEIKIVTDVNFEGEKGILAIKNNVTTFIDSIGIGKDLFLSEIYGYIYSVNGVQKVTSLKLSKDGGLLEIKDIEILNLECAKCAAVQVLEV